MIHKKYDVVKVVVNVLVQNFFVIRLLFAEFVVLKFFNVNDFKIGETVAGMRVSPDRVSTAWTCLLLERVVS